MSRTESALSDTDHPLLADTLDIHMWLENDAATPNDKRMHRDREIGRRLHAEGEVERILSWWLVIQQQPQIGSSGHLEMSHGDRAQWIRKVITWSLFAGGLLLGISSGGFGFAYEGDYPLNLLMLLGILLGIPSLLLLVTLVAVALRASGLKSVRAWSESLTLNAWLMSLWYRFGGPKLATSQAQNRFAFWQLVSFSQCFAIGYFIGIVLIFLTLLAFSDLAFGWSTTLDFGAEYIYTWTQLMSWPWQNFWPGAVPDFNLVVDSQYFRLDQAAQNISVQKLGDWWPFVLATFLFWGLLPRILLAGLAGWRTHHAIGFYLREHSEVSQLLDRLSHPEIELGNHRCSSDTFDKTNANPLPAGANVNQKTAADELDIQFKSSDSSDRALESLRSNSVFVSWHDAGQLLPGLDGANSNAPIIELAQLDQLAESPLFPFAGVADPNKIRAIVLTKGWEPPMLEFNDKLHELRQHLSAQTPIIVVPLSIDGGACSDEEEKIWATVVARLDDARIYVSRHQLEGFAMHGAAN